MSAITLLAKGANEFPAQSSLSVALFRTMSASIELTLERSFRSLWPVYGQLWPSVNTFETRYLVLCLDCVAVSYPSIADLLDAWSNFKQHSPIAPR